MLCAVSCWSLSVTGLLRWFPEVMRLRLWLHVRWLSATGSHQFLLLPRAVRSRIQKLECSEGVVAVYVHSEGEEALVENTKNPLSTRLS